jgi:hypothetical protein
MPFTKVTTDRRRELPKSRVGGRVFRAVSVGAVLLAPVAAMTLWLLISDPVTAAAVMERGDLLPAFAAILKMIGSAITAVLDVI